MQEDELRDLIRRGQQEYLRRQGSVIPKNKFLIHGDKVTYALYVLAVIGFVFAGLFFYTALAIGN